MKGILGVIGVFFGVLVVNGFVADGLEEEPHTVIINGKKYTKIKENVGDGNYAILLVPQEKK